MAGIDYIKGLNRGDKKVFKLVFEEFYPALVMFANRYVENSELAEDIVQDCFFKLWDKRKELHSAQGLKAYLYTTVKNKSINYLRNLKVKDRHVQEVKHLDRTFDFESFFIEEEALRLFYSIIDELPESQHNIIIKTLEGHNRDEIAEMMNISVDTVKYHKTKAYNYIRGRLGQNYFLLLIVAQWLKQG